MPARIDPKRIPKNPNEREILANQIVQQVLNEYSVRGFFRQFGDPRRSIEDEIGVPKWSEPIQSQEFRQLYDRHPIAARVIELFPKQMWMTQPEIYEQEQGEEPTEFERRFDEVCAGLRGSGGRSYYAPQTGDGNPLWGKCLEWDVLSGVGRYGALLLGLDDGAPLNQPVAGVVEQGSAPIESGEGKEGVAPASRSYSLVGNASTGGGNYINLRYVRPFSEDAAQVTRWENNRRSPRFGQPVEYMLSLSGSSSNAETAGIGAPYGTASVHWTRIVHLADNHHQTNGNPCLAPPRCNSVYDELMGLSKVYGASPEGYWKMAFTNISFETHPQLGGEVDINQTEVKDLIERVQNGLQKAWAIYGMSAKPIAPVVTDPTAHVNTAIEAICVKLGCPVPIFKGYEIGEQASVENKIQWNNRLGERERNHGTPNIVVPLVDRLILLGVLPIPARYYCKWPSRDVMSATEKASVLSARVAAYATYVGGNVQAVIPERDFMTRFDSLTEEEADAILASAVEGLDEFEPEPDIEAPLEPEAPETDGTASDTEVVEDML